MVRPATTRMGEVRPVMRDGFEVGIIGAGYAGLATAACLAHVGHRVRCIERDKARLAELAEGRLPFYGPSLQDLVRVFSRLRRGGLWRWC